MIEYFLEGNKEKLNAALIANGLSEDLRKYLWETAYKAYNHNCNRKPCDAGLGEWHPECVKMVLPYIHNDLQHNCFFIDQFVQACSEHGNTVFISYCWDYTLDQKTLSHILGCAIRLNDFELIKKLHHTSVNFTDALLRCTDNDNYEMAQYFFPHCDPLLCHSYVWFGAIQNNNTDMIALLQPHSHIVEAARHFRFMNNCRKDKTVLKTYTTILNTTEVFGKTPPNDILLARACINKKNIGPLLFHAFSQPVLEACFYLAVMCKNPTAHLLVSHVTKKFHILGHHMQKKIYPLFRAVGCENLSNDDLNVWLEWSVYEQNVQDVLLLLRSGMNCQPTLDKWESYHPDAIEQLIKHKECVDAEKQREVLLASTLGVHTNKERKI